MNRIKMSELAKQLHMEAASKGFWDHTERTESGVKLSGRDMQLQILKMHAELSEALEEHRCGRPAVYVLADDGDALYLETDIARFGGRKPEGWCVELADFAMMALDLIELLCNTGDGFDRRYEKERKDALQFFQRIDNPPEASAEEIEIAALAAILFTAHDALDRGGDPGSADRLAAKLPIVLAILDAQMELWGYDLQELMRLKLEYNKTRKRLHGKRY